MMTTKITMENTEMLKLKKSFSLFLCILFALIPTLSFSACKDDGFEIVQSITYVTDGEKITKTSQVIILTDGWGISDISEKQYLEIEDGYRFTYDIPMRINLSKDKKTVTSCYGLTEDDIGKTVGYYVSEFSGTISNWQEKRYYYSFTFGGWGYNYIQVKVIDHHTIIVKDNYDLSETTYTVTSYQITYFDEDK